MSSLDARHVADEEMPERIWAVKSIRPGCVVSFDTPSLDYNNEYIRADLVAAKDAEIAKLREALKPFAFEKASLNFDRFDEGNTAWVAVDGAGSSRVFFFVGDVIRARSALNQGASDGQ